ncbi:MAG: aldehyde dehydrogenase family protein [Gemmataceae bacterium]|nr:aldehyde dehydrogenase family protein [Gemmataceae bacterium]
MTAPPFVDEVAACRAAQEPWSRLPVRERLRPVRELRHLLVDRADDLLAAVEADVTRPPAEVLATDLLPTAAALKFLEREAGHLLKPRRVPGRLRPTWLFGCRDTVHRRPWGVVGVIGTWNYPVFLNVVQIAQAVAAGNGVLWKPSEHSARTAAVTADLFRAAAFPPDLLVTLPATREAGPLVAEAAVDHVVFTGSDAVGRKLAARLGERLIPSTLELSGCDAMFVLEDADIDLAAKAAWFGVTLNRGQTCIAVRRVFVQRSRYAAFAEALRPLAEGAKPVSLVAVGQAEQMGRLVTDAVGRGARVMGEKTPPPNPLPDAGRGDRAKRPHPLTPSPAGGGGTSPEPALLSPLPPRGRGLGGGVSPTILLGATPEMAVCREAAFAPVCAVIPFDTVDDAVSLAAGCPFGLAASVFTADPAAAKALAARVPAGHVTVNDVLAPTAHPATPFGGRGSSGWGVTQGAEGLLAMTTPQAVTVRRGRFRPHLDEAVAPDPATADILRGLLRATHGRGWRVWLGGARQLVRGVRRKR